jgi:putative methionine-R-sulfoxide reductase with GAF domain
MFLKRRRSHQILSKTSDNRPIRDIAQTETPLDRASLNVTLNVALRAAIQRTGATAAAIGLMCEGQLVCRARAGDLAPDLGVALNVATGITGACVRSAQALHCQDAETDARVDSRVCRTLGIRSILVIPIVINGAVAGIVETLSSNDHAFTSEHIKCLTIIANFLYASACAATAPSSSPRAHLDPETQSLGVRPQHESVEPVSLLGPMEGCQGSNSSAEDPHLAVVLRALQKSSPTATWDDICEQLISSFK